MISGVCVFSQGVLYVWGWLPPAAHHALSDISKRTLMEQKTRLGLVHSWLAMGKELPGAERLPLSQLRAGFGSSRLGTAQGL